MEDTISLVNDPQDLDERPDFTKVSRVRPRTFPYRELLPYKTESTEDTLAHLDHIINNLYIALKSFDTDYTVASSVYSTVLHWTRELHSWMQLKFDMPLSTRIKLARLYYELALSDVEGHTLEKIVSTFVWLCDHEAFLRYVRPCDLKLRAKPLIKAIKERSVPGEVDSFKLSLPKSLTNLCRLACTARSFFDFNETKALYQEILPIVSFFCPQTKSQNTVLTIKI